MVRLTETERSKVITCCNKGLITDTNFDAAISYPNEWFISLFSFVEEEKIRNQLGEAFYQARFTYKLMQVLHLTKNKNQGIVKFQIIQYASICEGLLNYVLMHHFRDEFEEQYATAKFVKCGNALSSKTQITFDNKKTVLCTEKKEKAKLELASNPTKSEFALTKGIISPKTKEDYCNLYDLRNNAHILKAAKSDYHPKITESKSAYELCFRFIDEIKIFLENHSQES